MLSFRPTLLALFVAASTSLASPALAATMKVTYTGTVFDSFDQNNLFGTGNTSLDGLGFVLEFIYDTAQAGFYYSDSQQSIAYGGPGEFGNGNPVLSSTFVIDGHLESVAGGHSGRIEAYNTGSSSGLQQSNKDYSFDAAGYENRHLTADLLHLGSLFSASLDATLPLTLLGPAQSGLGSFYFGTCAYDPRGNCSKNYQYAHGSLNFSTVQISRTGDVVPVPLPAALPMLVLSLAGLFLVTRRNRCAK